MVARATKGIHESLDPVVADASVLRKDPVESYARYIVDGVAELRELLRIMLRRESGVRIVLIYGAGL